MRFKNKTVLVTGGSNGIGKAISLAFQKEGAKAIVFDLKKPDFDAEFHKVDVTSEEQIKKAIASISKIDILVNNAGLYLSSSIEEVTSGNIDKIFDTNLKSAIFSCKYTMPLLKKSQGQIINISSAIAFTPKPNNFLYPMTKSGLIILTKALAQDYKKTKVRVNAVLPGPIGETSIIDVGFSNPKEVKEAAQKRDVPMGIIGKPEDVAATVLFVAESHYMNGSTVTLDGGRSSFFM